jgi:uncharacterized oligopeptide transporter (OPT) family protein
MLLHQAYGFRGQEGAGKDALAAVQANLMASVSQGVFKGDMPWKFTFIGMGVAIAIIILDLILEAKKSGFRTPVLAVAIGFYLPLELSVPIFAGGIIHWVIQGFHKRQETPTEQVEKSSRNGLLFASGLITGEALMGIILAVPIILLKQIDVTLPYWNIDQIIVTLFDFLGMEISYVPPIGAVFGTILLLGVAYWLYRTARGGKSNS